jgi:hypothetical protein
MSEWFNFYTLIAFVLGVLLSAMVKGVVSQAKAKVA